MRIVQEDVDLRGHGVKDAGNAADPQDLATLYQVDLSKSISILQPQVGDDITLFYTDIALDATAWYGMVRGSAPSATLNVYRKATRTAGGTLVATLVYDQASGALVSATAGQQIPAGSFVWIVLDACDGADELHLTAKYRATP